MKTIKREMQIVSIATMLTMSVSAKVCVWTGGGTLQNNNLYWSDANNWEGGNMPENGDTVSFEAKDATGHRTDMNITLENLFYTNYFGATFNGANDRTLTLVGTESEIVVGTSDMNWLSPLCVSANARLTIKNSNAISLKNPCMVSGAGEIVKTNGGVLSLYRPNNNFAGIWYFRNGEIRINTDVDYALGSSAATAHFYGDNESAGTSATFVSRYTAQFSNAFFFHDCGIKAYRTLTFDGDVTFVSEQTDAKLFYLEGVYNASYYSAASPPAYIMNGNVACDDSLHTCRILPQANGVTDYLLEFNGTVNFGTRVLELASKNTTDRGMVRINTPVVSTSSTGVSIYGNGVAFYCGADNVLGGSLGSLQDLSFGYSKKNSENLLLDLQGHDQTVRRLLFVQSDGYTTSGAITSSKGPATLYSRRVYNGATNHKVLSLNGEVSLSLEKDNATYTYDFVFSGGDTTGWILTDYSVCDLTQAAFPNLGGISLKAGGIAKVGATTALKNGVKLDFKNLTTGHLRVDTGVNIVAGQVVYGNVDVEAGTYCRTGAGVSGATEVAWLGGDDFNGTVTVSAHNPVLVWTGAGEEASITDAANWGANESPDLSDPTLTLDFRRATSASPIGISGTVAPACVLTSGDIRQGTPHFTGEGTLVLGGSGAVTNNFTFTGDASLAYTGTGTLVLKNSTSDTTGTLTIASGGKVILDQSAWYGKIVVESGAELEVLSSCGSSVFAPASGENRCRILLDGRLALGANVEASVKSLKVGKRLVLHDKTHGSSVSGAEVQDDVHFSGEGTVVSRARLGIVVTFQ